LKLPLRSLAHVIKQLRSAKITAELLHGMFPNDIDYAFLTDLFSLPSIIPKDFLKNNKNNDNNCNDNKAKLTKYISRLWSFKRRILQRPSVGNPHLTAKYAHTHSICGWIYWTRVLKSVTSHLPQTLPVNHQLLCKSYDDDISEYLPKYTVKAFIFIYMYA
jgi:hypothetical protein